MIKPNWNIFKAKFNDDSQVNFEWFCYLLFCQEFKKPVGIFRYKNQRGIETNTIQNDGEIIGWQAKFYETKLSDHKKDLVKTIQTSKKDHPDITKIILYSNMEWGQGKRRGNSIPKDDIEETAKDLGIDIEWKTASFFESKFVALDNEKIARHFFSFDDSIFKLLDDKQAHSDSVLHGIQPYITFNGKKIEIDRSGILLCLKNEIEQKQVSVLGGTAGVGKTAVIKTFYEEQKDKLPFYIYKATEFQVNNINELFNGFNFQDFIGAHEAENKKVIVIDSAEKLLDFKNQEPFKEFFSALIRHNWKIIFTIRDNYVERLNWELIEIYEILPLYLNVQNISLEELNSLSKAHNFDIPDDYKLVELIKNPFYLSEYLKFCEKGETASNFVNFKQILWNRKIKKTNPSREQWFIKIAFLRASEGNFFITPATETISSYYDDFVQDGILGYEKTGYFITHDIYEEWALENKIEFEFIQRGSNEEFFQTIGHALPIRRSFRSWLSEKLLLNDVSIKSFIEEVIENKTIEPFWQDEILVSVLLSDYSETFFILFKGDLLSDNQALLKRLVLLVRIACKEIDSDYLKHLGLNQKNILSIERALTKPKGAGWGSLIKFVYENVGSIGIKNIGFFIQVIHDWNSKFKEGITTKQSSLIALQYYQFFIQENISFSQDDVLKTILYGSSEIKLALEEVFKEIFKNEWKNHNDPYYELSKIILTTFDGLSSWSALPEYVLKLANLFWTCIPKKEDFWRYSEIGIAQFFSIKESHGDYYPSSAYQTPIYWLLQLSLRNTVDFILSFTNQTVGYFANSDLAKREGVEIIDVFIGENKSVKQYVNHRLWNIYRGTQVNPHVLESMHMALEKFFLERSKNIDSNTLENWLLYLLKNSISASISAVVTSIVLAFPDKTFNIAKILFQTKKFFFYEINRFVLDQNAKTQYAIGYSLDPMKVIYQDERIATCGDNHRKLYLETLALYYQVVRNKNISELDFEKRQNILWAIFDNYYAGLPNVLDETGADKEWRLCLARMDRRKMSCTIETKDEQSLISFIPEIDPKLKEYSKKSLEKSSEFSKYAALKMWAIYKIKNDEGCKQYELYEKNCHAALNEVKEIAGKLQSAEKSDSYFLTYSVPADVCSVLIKNNTKELSKEEKVFCKDIILQAASSSLRIDYQYQISDGVETAIAMLPILLDEFPEEKKRIKNILLLTLFDQYPIGISCAPFSDYSIKAILHNLWEKSFEDAQSILFGYLLLKPRYDELRNNFWQQKSNQGEIIENFLDRNKENLQKMADNTLALGDLGDIKQLDLNVLKTAFQLVPLKTNNNEHKQIVKSIIAIFAEKLLFSQKEEVEYTVKIAFLEKLAYFILSSPQQEITDYLQPFIDNFNNSKVIAELFQKFIEAEDRLGAYNSFWQTWELFYKKIVELSKNKMGNSWYAKNIIKSYLFANTFWQETAVEWHTFKETDKKFFNKISTDIGYEPVVLYSILKMLNDVGRGYLIEGMPWLSKMLHTNTNLWSDKLEPHTIYYFENYARRYIYGNRERIVKTKKLKQEVLEILNFLVQKESVVGYMLRENIVSRW